MIKMKKSDVRPKVSSHAVVEINQFDVIDWLVDNEFLTDVDKVAKLEQVRYLNPELMKYIASEMLLHIVESGAYDDALTHVVESGMINTFLQKFNAK
jgi:hypothetical protein